MKRLLAILLTLALMLPLCGCEKTSVNKSASVTLNFVHEEANIKAVLTDDEAAQIVDILDGKRYEPFDPLVVPACGYDTNISLQVGGRIFGIACDGCNGMQDYGNLRYFYIPEEDTAYIHSLFEKYGGYFPCI